MKLGKKIESTNALSYFDKFEELVIGDETCIYKALYNNWLEFIENRCSKGYTFRYVTPFIPEKYADVIFRYIIDLSKLARIKVVFNDLGLLNKCSELIKTYKIIPVIGRMITHSLCDCQWIGKIITNEDDEIKDVMISSKLTHIEKLSFFQSKMINEFEINLYDIDIIKELYDLGLNLTIYGTDILLSISRICYSAMWNQKELPQCVFDNTCNKKINLQLLKKWTRSSGLQKLKNIEELNMNQNIYIKGNAIYQDAPFFDTDLMSKYIYLMIY